MADKNLDVPKVIGKRLIKIVGSFQALAGAGTVIASQVRGLGFGYAPVNGVMALRAQPGNNPTPLTTPGILRTGTGLYTVTLENPYLECVKFMCNLGIPAAGVNLYAVPVEPTTGFATAQTGPTVTILLQTATGTPTDGANTERVYFSLSVRDSTTGYQKP
jgi:hypothetical protein